MRQTENTADCRSRWADLKARLATRLEALSAEVRSYPTPIARCDDQLPKLLDRRAAVQRLLRRANDDSMDGLPETQLAAVIEEIEREEERV